MIKDIQAEYLISPYFKDIYLYLAQNKLPSSKTAIKKIEALGEKYTLLDSLLFKIISTPDKEMSVLALPKMCRQVTHFIPFKFVCRTPRLDKNIFDYK